MIRIILMMLCVMAPSADRASAAEYSSDVVLAHDDGRADTKRSSAGTGHVVLFERPDGEFIATTVRIHGSRYGGELDPEYALARVSICDANLGVLAQSFEPYASWKVGRPGWIEVPVGPTRVPESFYVVVEFFPTRFAGIYLSIDDDAVGHGFSGKPGELSKALEEGEWMIQCVGSNKDVEVLQTKPGTEEWLVHGEGESIGKKSTAGTGHATLFKTAGRKRLVTGVSLCGQRYGSRYVPESTFFHVFVCDRKLKVLARFARPYSVFPTDDVTWFHIDLPPVAVPKDFAILVYFEPAQTKGIYLGQWEVEKSRSLSGLPRQAGEKLEKSEGWMIRARVAESGGKESLPALGLLESGVGPDALQVSETLAELDAAEVAEDLDLANAAAARLARMTPDEQKSPLTRFHESEHFFLRESGMPGTAVRALLRVYESAHTILVERFRFERVSAHPDKKIHVRVTIDESLETALFTNPRSADFSQIVWRGPMTALNHPGLGGPHVVYGLVHELGHVLMGWKDSRHQWAHYLGSVVTSLVHEELGNKGWFLPYDYNTIEGLPRFLKDIEGAEPGRETDAGVARLFYSVQERFGMDVYGPALVWIRENRPGEPFESVQLYTLDDLRDALLELREDKERVRELFEG